MRNLSALPPNRRAHAVPTRWLRKPRTTQRATSNPIVRSRWPTDAKTPASASASLARKLHEIDHIKARQLLDPHYASMFPDAGKPGTEWTREIIVPRTSVITVRTSKHGRTPTRIDRESFQFFPISGGSRDVLEDDPTKMRFGRPSA